MKKRKETPRPWPIRVLLWIIGDPWRKLLAVGLAIALYIQIDRDISDTQIISLRLMGGLEEAEEVNTESQLRLTVPGNYVILEAGAGDVGVDLVEVTLSGPTRSLPKTRGLQTVKWAYSIDTTNLDLSSGETEVTLPLEEVVRAAGSIRDLEVTTNYESLHVSVGTTGQRNIQLRLRHLGEPAVGPPEGYTWKAEETEFSPSEIRVSGPTPYLARFEELVDEHGSLFVPVNLGDLTRDDIRQLDFADWLGDYGLRIDRPFVDARFYVEDRFESFDVPISVDDVKIRNEPPGTRVELQDDPRTRPLTIEVPLVLANRLRLEEGQYDWIRTQLLRHYLLYVDADELENAQSASLQVKMDFLRDEEQKVAAPDLLSAYERVHLAEDPLLWEADRRDKPVDDGEDE